MKKGQVCVLDDEKICNECGECDRCDLDPQKICDNCGKCIETNENFKIIKITGIEKD